MTHSPHIGPASTRSGKRIARWVLCLVACCLGFQGWILSVERASGRAHFHQAPLRSAALSPSTPLHARTVTDLDGHRYAPEISSNADADQSPSQRAHDHHGDPASIAHHDHDADDAGVVYVAEDDGASTLNPHPTLTRGIHDLAVVMNPFGLPAEAETAADWAKAVPPAFSSHVSGPPERPPRA